MKHLTLSLNSLRDIAVRLRENYFRIRRAVCA